MIFLEARRIKFMKSDGFDDVGGWLTAFYIYWCGHVVQFIYKQSLNGMQWDGFTFSLVVGFSSEDTS